MGKNESRNREKSDEAVVFRAFGGALFTLCGSALLAAIFTYALISEVIGGDFNIIVRIIVGLIIIFCIGVYLITVFENAQMLRAKIIIDPKKIVLVGATHETKKKRSFISLYFRNVDIEIPWRDIRRIEQVYGGGLSLQWQYTVLHFKTTNNSDYTMILDYFDGRKLKKEISKYKKLVSR